ncbi:hypothetical protein CPAV1605_1219 [seawater metagenome]|uniref:AAA+ ATPase domain-containing protein n=1 Tax=seawater metagenome TaxID=1561972 RepID=A0A5E8CJE9_9ZZZZ
MLYYILFLIYTIFLFFNTYKSNFFLITTIIFIIYKTGVLFKEWKNKRKLLNAKDSFKVDYNDVMSKADNKFLFNSNLIFCFSILMTTILYSYMEYLNTRYFKLKKIFLLSFAFIYPVLATLCLWDNPFLYYFNTLELNYIEKFYDLIFYKKVIRTDIKDTDNLNKELLITFLEKSKNLMKEYTTNKNLLRMYVILLSADFFLISFFCNLKWVFKMVIAYCLFYLLIFRKYNIDQNIFSSPLQSIISRSSNTSNFIFSDFRNMILYNNRGIDNNYIDTILENNDDLFENRKKNTKYNSIFMFKVGLFKRLVYFSTIVFYYYKSKLSFTTVSITESLVVISYMFMMNDHIFFSINHLTKALKITDEYNKYRLDEIKNHKYRGFLEKISNNIKYKDNTIYLYETPFKNKIIYLRGKSGKGKTTILKNIVYNIPELSICYLSQELELNLKNINLKKVIQGFLIEENDDYIKEAMDISCLSDKFLMDSVISEASGGEKQRIRIARVIYYLKITKSNILVMDEPDNNLDSLLFQRIINNILKLENLKHIILTSHKFSSLQNIPNIQIYDIK